MGWGAGSADTARQAENDMLILQTQADAKRTRGRCCSGELATSSEGGMRGRWLLLLTPPSHLLSAMPPNRLTTSNAFSVLGAEAAMAPES